MARWYPNADGKCSGSFLTVIATIGTVVNSYNRHGDVSITRVKCPHCGRAVGARTKGKGNKFVLAQHMPGPVKSDRCARPGCGRALGKHALDSDTQTYTRCPNTVIGSRFTLVWPLPEKEDIAKVGLLLHTPKEGWVTDENGPFYMKVKE